MRRRRDTPLWLRLLWRRLRSPEGRLAPLAVLSIAISVTLATGLEMSSRSAQRQVEETAAALTGSADIEVVAGEVGVPEAVLELVRSVPGVRIASPMVTVIARVADRDLALNIVGVDLVAEEQVQRTTIERAGLQVRDTLRLLATPNAVVVTRKLLDRLGLSEKWARGEPAEIRVRTNSGESTLVVQAMLEDSGVAAAFDGQVAVMDIFAAQALARREGLFDRIDVVAEDENGVSDLIAKLNAALTSGAVAQTAQWQTSTAAELLEIVRRATAMFAAAAALVAGLLTYATTGQWVERQRRQLATLRAVGMEAERIRRGLFVEIGVLAALGTGLGLLGGVLVSPPVLSTLSAFLMVSNAGAIDRLSLEAPTLWAAATVGLVGGLAGAVLPARRASQRFTLDALEVAGARSPLGRRPATAGVAAVVVFVLAALWGRVPFEGQAMARLGVMLVASVIALLVFSPAVLRSLSAFVYALRETSPLIGHLGARGLSAHPWTFAVALTAVAILTAALVASFLLIETIGSGAERWSLSRHGDGILVTASPSLRAATALSEALTPDTVERIRTTPGVSAVAEHYRNRASVLIDGRTVRLVASSMDVLGARGGIASIGRPSPELAHDLSGGAIAITPGFDRKFGMRVGDEIEIETHKGRHRFRISGLFEDYGPPGGAILMDLRTFDLFWERPGASSVSIWIDGHKEPVLEQVRARVGDSQDLFFTDSRGIAEANRQNGELFRGVLGTLSAFLAALGGVGVTTLFIGIVAQRRRDFALLRASGAAPGQLVKVILFDAATLGLCGVCVGTALGFACAVPAADVVRESWGWTMEQVWFAQELPAIVVGGVVAATLGGLIPARMASGTPAADVFGPE